MIPDSRQATDLNWFGTDGVRGKVGQGPITPEFFVRLGWALGRILHARHNDLRHRVVIGKDTRISGYMLETALQSGLIAAGADVYMLGPMPTPAVAWLTHTLKSSAGVVITASHNPHHDNGLKIFDKDGHKFSGEWIAQLEDQVEQDGMHVVASSHLGKVRRINDAGGRYIEHCKEILSTDRGLEGMKIVIDCAHGATYQVAPQILGELGAELECIGVDPDGLNINEGCGSTSPELLRRTVLSRKADLGIAFDGDGDRLVCVDHEGKLVNGDKLLYVIACDMLRREGDCAGVVGTGMSNMGLEEALRSLKIPFFRAPVGDRHVKEAMEQRDWPLGGESSGHIICAGIATTGDGIVTALRMLDIMLDTGKPLAKLTEKMRSYQQKQVNISGAHRDRVDGDTALQKAIARAEAGLKGGRVMVRSSGTEPVVRVMVEGAEGAEVEKAVRSLEKQVRELIA